MSGLALLCHLSGRPAAANDLDAMLAEMAARGPEGEARATSGSVAIGHRLLVTTPEAAVEPMPLHHPNSDRWITGEIRLDNRAELLARFGLEQAGRVVGDGELVLRAFDHWGEDCAAHLLGDFAFAIWDPGARRIFAARDHTGMRQLIYAHRPGQIFACASSARAVACAPGLSPRLNELRLAEALIDAEVSDFEITFFEGVLRLPPAHCLTLDDRGLRTRAYWTMTPPPPLRLRSDAEYSEAFREVLTLAVRDRMRGQAHIGAMLSGGMDSGSVVALASRMTERPLPTFSVIGPDPSIAREVAAIRASAKMPNLAPQFIDYSDPGDLVAPLLEQMQAIEEPFDIGMSTLRACYLSAAGQGLKVVLDGVAGDLMLEPGNFMPRLLRDMRWSRAFREAHGGRRLYGNEVDPVRRQLYLAIRQAFLPFSLRFWRTAAPKVSLPSDALIDQGFAERSGLIARRAARPMRQTRRRPSYAEERIDAWPRSGLTIGRERYDRVAAASGIEPRDPYMDRRVLEFCLSLPYTQFVSDGFYKAVQRRAMEGLMPDSVCWSPAKEHPGWLFTRQVLRAWHGLPGDLLPSGETLDGRLSPEQSECAASRADPWTEGPWDPPMAFNVSVFLRGMRGHPPSTIREH